MSQSETWPIKVKWMRGFQLIGHDEKNHSVVMDLPKDKGGEDLGISPTKLLLVSLAGCTAMDIVLLMEKQRQDLKGLDVLISGEQHLGEFPHYFTRFNIRYVARGKNLSEEVVKRAIQLSDDKYCSVGATLKGKAEISTSYELVND